MWMYLDTYNVLLSYPCPPIQMACLFLYINDVFPLFSLFILLKCQVFKKTNRKVVLQPITLKHHKKEEKPFIHFSLQRSFILFMMIICRLNTAPPFTLCFIRCCRNVWTGTWGRFIFAWFQKTITLSNLAVRLQLMLNAKD